MWQMLTVEVKSGEERKEQGWAMDRGEGREIQFQSPVSLVTLIAMNRLENITYGGGKETTAGGEGGAELCNMARPSSL